MKVFNFIIISALTLTIASANAGIIVDDVVTSDRAGLSVVGSITSSYNMTDDDLDMYQGAIEYLDCYQSGGLGCQGALSYNDAIQTLNETKNYKAEGYIAEEKYDLDAKARYYINRAKDYEASGYMDQEDLQMYTDAIKYLECVNGGGERCNGANSLDDAKMIIDKVTSKPAIGTILEYKEDLDVRAEKVMTALKEKEEKQSTLITSGMLNQYEDALNYLSCYHDNGGNSNCNDDAKAAEARKVIADMRMYSASGINASKKRQYDTAADKLLPKITQQEVTEFFEKLGKLEGAAVLNEFSDSGIVRSILTTPGDDTMAMALDKNFSYDKANSDSVTIEMEKTKQEMLDLQYQNGVLKQRGGEISNFLQGVSFNKEISNVKDTTFNNESTVATVKQTIKNHDNNISMEEETVTTMVLKRDPLFGYEIKIYETEYVMTKKMKADIYSKDKVEVIEIHAEQIEYGTVDTQWVNRYAEEERVELSEREYMGNTFILKQGIRQIKKYQSQAQDIVDPKEKQVIVDKANKMQETAKKAYDALKKDYYADSKDLLEEYDSLISRNY